VPRSFHHAASTAAAFLLLCGSSPARTAEDAAAADAASRPPKIEGAEIGKSAAASDAACANPHGKLTATLRLAGTDADLRALLLALRYPEGKVSIPGRGNAASVASRIKARNGSAQATPNDTDGALKVELIDPFAALGYPPAEIEFDLCDGSPVSRADFDCRVEFASDKTAAVLNGVSCAVDVP
jgi:hypothetical protein